MKANSIIVIIYNCCLLLLLLLFNIINNKVIIIVMIIIKWLSLSNELVERNKCLNGNLLLVEFRQLPLSIYIYTYWLLLVFDELVFDDLSKN